MTKHLVSIMDMVDDLEAMELGLAGGGMADLPVWREKIGDAINYLILLEALVAERLCR